MNKKRLFFCEIYDDGTVGGSHSILFNLATNLDSNLFEITIGFLNDNIYVKKFEEQGIKVKILKDFVPSHFPVYVIRKAINWNRLIRQKIDYLYSFFKKNKFDLVVINNTLYTATPYIKACKKAEIPIVIYERGINTYSSEEILISEYVSVSIPMSDAIYNSVIEQGVRAKKIIRIYDGINPEGLKASKSREDILRKLHIPNNSRIIGIIGNVKPWKGQEFFVKALIEQCQKYSDVYAVIAGAWKEKDLDFKRMLDELVAKADLTERIKFLGYRTDVADILSVLTIFVHASTKPEPFGMVVPEAMAAKVPVIATNFGGPVESLDGGNCGILVPPKDAQAIVKACETYLNDETYRQQVINKAYQRYIELFTLKKNVEITSNLFIEIINEYKNEK